MDESIVKAIMSLIGTLITVILTPVVKWALQSLPSKSLPQEKRDKINRRGFLLFASILIIFFMLTTILFVSATSKYRNILPDFGLATCSPFQSNSSMSFELQKNIAFPPTLDWLKPRTSELRNDPHETSNSIQNTPLANITNPPIIVPSTECVFFESHLQSAPSWTGFMFSKAFFLFSVDLSKKSEMLLVLKAEVRDRIELGLKDINQNETKITFAVEQGWHGYIIPIERFRRVNKNRIQILLIAHSSTVKLADNNQFRISRLEFR